MDTLHVYNINSKFYLHVNLNKLMNPWTDPTGGTLFSLQEVMQELVASHGANIIKD